VRFPSDRPLINVSQAAPVDPPPDARRQVMADVALKRAIQMILTIQVCVLFVVWMRPREIVLTVLAATGICGVLSVFITSYHDGAMTGIFAHKNMLGAKMLLLWCAAICIALDSWIRAWVRVCALGLAALALALILASHSATALVLAVVIGMAVVGFSFFAGHGARTPVDRAAVTLIIAGILGVAIPTLVAQMSVSPVSYLLGALGKSSTLTGRTELWAYAEDVIRTRPWIGYGAGGFWRYEENDLVRQIFAEFHKSPKQVFSFHNSFYEVTVHFGLIGLGLTLFTLLWATYQIFAQLLVRGGMPFIFFPTVAMVGLIRGFVESSLMGPLIMANMLLWIGAVYAKRYPLR
jgi:exopolysaccharide production protein ExoQ